MADRSIVVCGLPASGKTTFLGALWHLVFAREIPTALRFSSLRDGDNSHLNAIAKKWRYAETQDRTERGPNRVISMNLLDRNSMPLRLSLPDLSGEAYQRMFEDRDCDSELARILVNSSDVLLFEHADRIAPPRSVVETTSLVKECQSAAGSPEAPCSSETSGGDIPALQWDPRLAPTQVKLVDLLQLLREPPLDIGPRRVAVMLTAWDKVSSEQRTPVEWLSERLPLLYQYLQYGADCWEWQVYGISAQGGSYYAGQ
jgi:hypothetical protein